MADIISDGSFSIYSSTSNQTSTSLTFNGNVSLYSSAPYVQTALTYSIFDNELFFSAAQSLSTKSANPFYIYTTDGLKLYVNAFSKDSYPGTGNTWYDLSGNNANITLVNSPIKSPYSFDFSGANDYATGTVAINDTTAGDTVTVEILLHGDLSGQVTPFSWGSFTIYYKNSYIGFNTFSDDVYGIDQTPLNLEYNHFVFVFKRNQLENCKLYINGNIQTLAQRINVHNNSNAIFNNGSFVLGAIGNNSYNSNIKVNYLRIYNKELTQSEITQNYTWSTKIFYPFFTIPSAPEKVSQDLILDIDAGNLYSYPSSGTKVISPKTYDNPSILRSMIMPLGLSTNYTGGDVEGVLYNGVGFSTNFGGVWNFDGTNDYISLGNVPRFDFDNGNFTISLWVRFTNITSQRTIFTNYQNSNNGWAIQLYGQRIIVNFSGDGADIYGTIPILVDKWYSIVVTGKPNEYKLFTDNIQDGPTFTGSVTLSSSAPTLIGQSINSAWVQGQISNVSIYSRALTEAERKFNYDALSPRFQVQALNNLNYLPAKEMYPEIAQTGLLLNIDPGYYKSYTGTGTSIYSLVNNYTGTLNNGVGYSSKNYGQIVFDGTNDYISVPNADILNLGSSFTISTWVKINDLTSPSFASFINTLDISSVTKGYTLGWFRDAAYNINAKSIMLQFGVNAGEWNIYSSDTNSITDNNFHHIVVTALNINTNNPTVIFYIDGIQKNTTWWNNATKRPISYNTDINNVRIGHYYTPTTPSYYNSYSPMNLGNIQIYTTVLSSKDIKQNYYATYWKYNTQIKSGQQLYLDAGNNNSYSGSGTSILDISGNNRTGTLVNGVGFSNTFDGILTFDGTNDYVSLNVSSFTNTSGSYSGWFYFTQANNNCALVLTSGNPMGEYSLVMGITSTNRIKAYIWDGSGKTIQSSITVSTNQWYHITLTWVDNSFAYLYIDGAFQGSVSLLSTFKAQVFLIGSQAGTTSGLNNYFQGSLSNFQVYSRALSFSEIQENYTAYASKFGKSGVDFLLESSSLRNLNTPKPLSIISAENLPSHTFNNIFYDKFDYGLNLTLGDTDFYEFASDFGIQQLGMYNFWMYPMGFNSDPGAKYSFNTGLNAFLDFPGAPLVNTASFERNGIYRAPSNPGNKVIAYNVNYARGSSFFYSGFLKTNLYYETTGLTGLGIGLQSTEIKNGYFAVIDVRNGTGETAAFQLRKDINNTVPLATDTSITIQADRWYRISFAWSSAGLITVKLYDGVGVLISTLTVTDTSYTSGYLGITSYSLSSYDNLTNIFNLLLSPSAISTAEAFNNNNVIFPGNVNLLSGTIAKIQVINGLSIHYDIGNSGSYNGTTTLTNLAGASYNGTILGSPVLFNTYGKYLEFNTSSDLISVPSIPDSFWNNGSWTVNAWVWINAPKLSGLQRYILVHGTSGTNNNWLHLAISNAGTLRFGLWNNDLDSVTALSPNRWYYVSFRYDRTALTKRIYIDGVLDASASSNAYIGTGSNTTIFNTIGGRGAKVEIYNRALQPQEINQNYMASKDRFGNNYLIPKFYEQFESTSTFTEGDLDHYIRLIDYGPGYGINALFTPPYMAGYVSAAGWTGYGLARVPGESFKIVNTSFSYLSDSNFFWSGWIKIQPNYQTSSISGLGFGIQSTNTLGYFAVIDIRNGTGSTAAFQLRKDIYSAPLATATNITIVQDEWYRITTTWNDGTIIANLHNKFGDIISTLTIFNYSYTSGKVGIVSYSNASFDNFTNLTFLTISKVKVRPDLITENLQFYYSPSNLESYQGTGNALIDMSKNYSIINTGLIVHLEAGNKSSYPGTGNIWYSLVGNAYGELINNVGFVDNYKASYFTLNGTNQYIQLNNFNFTQSSSANQYTIIISAKLNSTSASRRQLISPDDGGFDWGIGAGDGTKFSIFTGNDIQTGRNQDTNWHIFAGQWSFAGTKLYIDDSLDVNTTTISFESSINVTNIGRNPGYGEYWHGNVSTVLIYDRILTTQELTQIYNSLRITTFPALLNNVTYSNDNSGSLVFNGTNSYIDVPYTQTAVTKYSISMWVKTTQSNTTLIYNRGITSTSGVSITLKIGSGKVQFIPCDGDGIVFGTLASTIINDNLWHHIVVVMNGTSGLTPTEQNFNSFIKIYVDNNLETLTFTGAMFAPALPYTGLQNLQIGRSVAWNEYYSGQIGTVQIFTKALTATEVRGIYTGLENPGVGTHTIKPEIVNIPSGTIPSLENVNIQNIFANYNLRHLSVLSSEILPNTNAFTNIFYEQFETASSLNFGDTVNYVKSDTTDQVYGLNTFNEPPPINAGATGFGIYWFTMGPLYKPFVKYTGISGFGMKRVDNQSGNKVLIYQTQYNKSSSFFWSGFVRTSLGYITTGLSGIAFGIQPSDIYNGYFAVIDIRNGIADTAAFQLRKGINNLTPLAFDMNVNITLDKWYRITAEWKTNGDITVRLYSFENILLSTLSVNDTTYSSGYIGLTSYSNSLFDNFTNINSQTTLPSTILSREFVDIHRINAGTVSITQFGSIITGETTGIHSIKVEIVYMVSSPIDSREFVPTQRVNPGPVRIFHQGFSNVSILGSHTLLAGGKNLSPTTILTGQILGTHRIKPEVAKILHRSLINTNILGIHRLNPGNVNINSVTSIPSQEQFENYRLVAGVAKILPSSFTVAHILGIHTVRPGVVNILSGTISSREFVNRHSLSSIARLIPTSILTGQVLGLHAFQLKNNISAATILSAEALGIHLFKAVHKILPRTLVNNSYVETPKFIFEIRDGFLKIMILPIGTIGMITNDYGNIIVSVTSVSTIE